MRREPAERTTQKGTLNRCTRNRAPTTSEQARPLPRPNMGDILGPFRPPRPGPFLWVLQDLKATTLTNLLWRTTDQVRGCNSLATAARRRSINWERSAVKSLQLPLAQGRETTISQYGNLYYLFSWILYFRGSYLYFEIQLRLFFCGPIHYPLLCPMLAGYRIFYSKWATVVKLAPPSTLHIIFHSIWGAWFEKLSCSCSCYYII